MFPYGRASCTGFNSTDIDISAKKCGKTFKEDIPFVYSGTRITERAAHQIKGFLKNKVSIRAIQEMTGIHWDTIRKIQTEYMKEKIAERKAELEMSGYKPKFLAVDEFAIHKGHRYATIYKIILLKNNF